MSPRTSLCPSAHRLVIRALASIAIALPLGQPLPAQMTQHLYVENSEGGDVTVISIPQHRVVSTIPASVIGNHPDDVVLSRDGRVLFVNRLDMRDVVAVDTKTEKLLWKVDVGGQPHHMTLARDGRTLFVPLFDAEQLVAVDTERREVIARIPVAPGPHATRISPNGQRLYVGGLLSDQITVVDIASRRVVRTHHFPDGVRPFEISPDETRLYVQVSGLQGFHVFDLAENRVTQTVHLPASRGVLPAEWPRTVNHGMALTRDGTVLMVAASLDDYVAFYSVSDFRLLAKVPTGKLPGWLTLSPDQRYVYSSNRGDGDNTISVISVEDRKEITRLKGGNMPQRMVSGWVDRGTATAATRQARPYFPTTDASWERRRPATMGLDSTKVQAAIAFAMSTFDPASQPKTEAEMIAQQEAMLVRDLNEPPIKITGPMKPPQGVHGLILKGGYIVGEFGNPREVEVTASLTKSIVSTVAGFAFDDGKLTNLDEPVGRLVRDGGYDSPHNAKITWRQSLQQTSEWVGELWGMTDLQDRRGALRTAAVVDPGTRWGYNDVRVNRLSLSLMRLHEKPLPDVLRERIMKPIGASDTWQWHGYATSWTTLNGKRVQSVSGGAHWGGGFWVNSYDIARIGLVYARDGKWGDRQLISSRWIKEATTPAAIQPGYGFLFWLNTGGVISRAAPPTAYSMMGGGGHYCWIDPQNDIVVITKWLGGGQPGLGRFLDILYSGLN